MKRLLSILILTVLLCAIPMGVTSADTTVTYRKVETNTFVYHSASDTHPLFEIFSGCYVKIVSETSSTYAKVSYMDKVGYVKSSDLSAETYTDLIQPYHSPITIRYKSDDPLATTHLSSYPNSLPVDSKPITQIDDLLLVGLYDTSWLYVSYDGIFGFIPAGETNWHYSNIPAAPLDSVNFPEPEPTVNPDENTGGNEGGNGDEGDGGITIVDPTNNLTRVLLIIGICIPAVIIVYLLFKPVKTSDRYSMDDVHKRDDYKRY